MTATPHRVGYVLKRYPRYSETFVVTEILAHERAGAEVEIFALRPPTDTHFQDAISRVRAPVTYLFSPDEGLKAAHFWSALQEAGARMPGMWPELSDGEGESVKDVYQAIRLAALIKARSITHLHAHFATSATAVARLAGKLSGVPYTFTAHAKDIFHSDVRREDLARKISSAAAVVTVSDFNRQFLRSTFPESADRIRRVYNGLELTRFPFSSPGDRLPLVLGVGRLVEKKGFDVLIEACGQLASQGVAFECQIVGSGELEASLTDQVKRLGLESVVRLVGPRPQPEVIELMQQAAVFAAPCVVGGDGNRDGLPTVLLEAMALGTPIVSTDVTGIPEVVRDDETGLLVPQRDVVRLTGAIERLLSDSALGVELAVRARRLIEAEFDTDRSAARIRDVIDQSAPLGALAGVGA